MSNEIWTGEEAHEYGAIDVLVDPASLLETATGLATMWSSWGSHTKEATKHLLHVQTDNDFSTHLDHERTLIEAARPRRRSKKACRLPRSAARPLNDSLDLNWYCLAGFFPPKRSAR